MSRSVTEAFDFRTETGSHFCRKDNNIRPGLTVGLVAVGVCLAVVSGAAGAADADGRRRRTNRRGVRCSSTPANTGLSRKDARDEHPDSGEHDLCASGVDPGGSRRLRASRQDGTVGRRVGSAPQRGRPGGRNRNAPARPGVRRGDSGAARRFSRPVVRAVTRSRARGGCDASDGGRAVDSRTHKGYTEQG